MSNGEFIKWLEEKIQQSKEAEVEWNAFGNMNMGTYWHGVCSAFKDTLSYLKKGLE